MNRMASSERLEKNPLLYWRINILSAFLITGFLLGTLVLAAVLPFLIQEKKWFLMVTDCVVYLVFFALVLCRLNYKIRATLIVLMAYIIGLAVILAVGPLSGGPIWLFSCAVLAGIFLGLRAALTAIIFNGITLGFLAWLITTGRFGADFPFFNSLKPMIAASVNFMLLNLMAALAIHFLVKGLASSHQKELVLSGVLEKEKEQLRRAKEKLAKSEKGFRDLFDSITDLIFTQDLDGRFLTVNQALCNLFGYGKDELLGRQAKDFMKPEMRPLLKPITWKSSRRRDMPKALPAISPNRVKKSTLNTTTPGLIRKMMNLISAAPEEM